MAREVFFYHWLWVTKFCAKFGCARTPRTANAHKSFIVLRCMWKEPAPFKIKSRWTKCLEITIIYQFHPPSSWNLYLWRNNSFLKEDVFPYPIAQWNGSKSFISEVSFAKGRLCAFPHPKIFLQQTGILLPQQIFLPHSLTNILPQYWMEIFMWTLFERSLGGYFSKCHRTCFWMKIALMLTLTSSWLSFEPSLGWGCSRTFLSAEGGHVNKKVIFLGGISLTWYIQ